LILSKRIDSTTTLRCTFPVAHFCAEPSHGVRKKAIKVKDKTKSGHDRPNPAWVERQQNAKDDPEAAKQLKAAQHVIEKYGEALQRLADF
jgi:hypothetical protein